MNEEGDWGKGEGSFVLEFPVPGKQKTLIGESPVKLSSRNSRQLSDNCFREIMANRPDVLGRVCGENVGGISSKCERQVVIVLVFLPLFVSDILAYVLVLSVALFHAELCLFVACFLAFFLSLFLFFSLLPTYSMNT